MLLYYFYNNINKCNYTFNIYLFLIALVVELNNIIFNILYLNRFFFKLNNCLINKNKKFNLTFFFFKINYIVNILKEYIFANQKVKS